MSQNYKLEFSVLEKNENIDDAIATLSELHKKRMRVKGEMGSSLTPQFWRFHQQVARDFLDRGWLLIGILKADDTVVACQYAYQYNDKLFHYQSGIDPKFSKYSVGLISNAYMIRESIKRGLKEYDFLRGEESYKSHWAKNYRKNMEVVIFNKGIKSRLSIGLYYCMMFFNSLREKFEHPKRDGKDEPALSPH